jgi:hypothetical protein
MPSRVAAFWAGVVAAYLVLMFTASSTTVDVDILPGEANGVTIAERVDAGPLSRILNPGVATLGTLRLTKRNWGAVTTYRQELGVPAARIARAAGGPLTLKSTLTMPGRVVESNATSQDGNALVWTEIPSEGPLAARTRAVNWPVVVLAAAGIAATLLLRRR